jgi:hypothetical protein
MYVAGAAGLDAEVWLDPGGWLEAGLWLDCAIPIPVARSTNTDGSSCFMAGL